MIRAVDLFCGAGGTSEGLAQAAAALGKPLQLTASTRSSSDLLTIRRLLDTPPRTRYGAAPLTENH